MERALHACYRRTPLYNKLCSSKFDYAIVLLFGRLMLLFSLPLIFRQELVYVVAILTLITDNILTL